MKIIVTGGAGFVGSHLVGHLLQEGHEVVCVDSLFSGKKENISEYLSNPRFRFFKHDIRSPLKWSKSEALDRIYNLACPASPDQYQFDPVMTMEVCVVGAKNMLELARLTGARILQASTSEVYGDPLEHPQKETYWGNVDPIGERSCYDEGKRAAESLCKDYHEQFGVDVRLVRIFNTYGPRMMFNDGRALSNFVLQALLGEDITVHGDGLQTRSFMYVSDLVEGLIGRMEVDSKDWKPVNLGNPDEKTMLEIAARVKEATASKSKIVHLATVDIRGRIGDPRRRCPDIARAKNLLGWEPKVGFNDGLQSTIADFKKRLLNLPHVAVFATTFSPLAGPAERAAREVMDRLPGYEFDVICARMEKTAPAFSKVGRINIYRLGVGKKSDKFFLPFRAGFLARSLHKKNKYRICWSVMASYGALGAYFFNLFNAEKAPVLLSAYEGDITEKMTRRGKMFGFVYRLIFASAHRWQVVGRMTEWQRAWLEDERKVQAVNFDGNWDLLAKRTKESLQQIEILSTRL